MGISCWYGRAEGVGSELKAGPRLEWWHLRAVRAGLGSDQGWKLGHKQLGAVSLGPTGPWATEPDNAALLAVVALPGTPGHSLQHLLWHLSAAALPCREQSMASLPPSPVVKGDVDQE